MRKNLLIVMVVQLIFQESKEFSGNGSIVCHTTETGGSKELFFFLLRKISPELTSVANLPFLLDKDYC